VDEVNTDLLTQLHDATQKFAHFSVQSDDRTDTSDAAQLLTFTPGVNGKFDVITDLLEAMGGTAAGVDLYERLSAAFE
jgi:hypothetical protein